jgi:hypothetical protein
LPSYVCEEPFQNGFAIDQFFLVLVFECVSDKSDLIQFRDRTPGDRARRAFTRYPGPG